MNEKYIPLATYAGEWMFTDESIPVPAENLVFIKPLQPVYSKTLWARLVTPTHDHLMLLPAAKHQQVFGPREAGPFWYADDWEANVTQRISTILQECIPWAPRTVVYFFWSAHQGIETTWQLFVQHWLNFLFEDEAAILVSEETRHVVNFSLGRLWIGTRL